MSQPADLVDFSGTQAPVVYSVLVTNDAVFLSGSGWSGFSTLTAGTLKTAVRVISFTSGHATVSTSGTVNYSGGIREIIAEPIDAENPEDDSVHGMPPLFSKLPHASMLLAVDKSAYGGSWWATPKNVKKIGAGDLVVATPPITQAIRSASVKIRFPDQEIRNAVVARVTAVHDIVFTGRQMRNVSFSGAPGVICDGLVVYSG